MAARLAVLIPTVVKAREALNELFVDITKLTGIKIPCSTLEAYGALRRRLTDLEMAIVAAAKANGLRPPEDAPRSFALVSACQPNAMETSLDKSVRATAEAYIVDLTKRRAAGDKALLAAYKKDDVFRAGSSQILKVLQPLAKAGTTDALPEPQNIGLLRYVFGLGGSLWNVEAVKGLLGMSIADIEENAGARIARDIEILRSGLGDLAGVVTPEGSESGTPPWVWGLSALVVGGVGAGAFLIFRQPEDDVYRTTAHVVEDDEDDEEEEYRAPARGRLLRGRR